MGIWCWGFFVAKIRSLEINYDFFLNIYLDQHAIDKTIPVFSLMQTQTQRDTQSFIRFV